jgi:hypothetical protein
MAALHSFAGELLVLDVKHAGFLMFGRYTLTT